MINNSHKKKKNSSEYVNQQDNKIVYKEIKMKRAKKQL